MSDRISRELAAYEAFSKWMKDGEGVRQLFAEAGLSLPERLAKFLGSDGLSSDSKIIIPPPSSPKRPPGADTAWIFVPVSALLISNLVLGVLRYRGVAMKPREIIEVAEALGGKVKNEGSVANLGKSLEEDGTIARTPNGWVLRKDRRAPIIAEKFAWGALDAFTVQEIAAHRRQIILHILGLHPSGLQPAQLVSVLESCDWRNGVPVGKDLVKLDIEALSDEKRIRRVGGSAKWEVMPDVK